MRTYQLGAGQPDIAIVGAVHGDEPCGARAIERLVAADPPVERPVKLIVANERALERDVRWIDTDLNRVFDEDLDEDTHEHQLASRLTDEIAGCTVLSIHSTHSYADPFAMVSGLDERPVDIAARLPVVALLDIGSTVEGRPFVIEAAYFIEIEAGEQRSERAAENALELSYAFLRATGALPGEAASHQVPTFRMEAPIPKPSADRYEVEAENFKLVDRGETFARADDRRLVAGEPFYPLLLSADGYDDIFGYTGDHVGYRGTDRVGEDAGQPVGPTDRRGGAVATDENRE